MPAQRKLAQYPPEYRELFARAARAPVVLQCESASRARSLRGDLYNFRTAYFAELSAAEAVPEFALQLNAVTISLTGRRLILESPEPENLSVIRSAIDATSSSRSASD